MSHTPDPRSVPQLLSDLARELTTLFRKEGQLIRAELSEKATQLQIGAGSALAGAIVLLVSLNVLAAALVVAISKVGEPDIGGGWAASGARDRGLAACTASPRSAASTRSLKTPIS